MRLALLLASAASCFAADETVKVFILMGQSNMLGEGKVLGWDNGTLQFAVTDDHLYPYLVDGIEAAVRENPVESTVQAPGMCDAAGFEHDIDYHDGQGLHHEPANDAGDCCTKCSAYPGCKFFTFTPDASTPNGMCWYKPDHNGRRGIKGAVSGGIMPEPPPPPPRPPSPPPPPTVKWAVRKDVRNVALMGNGNASYEQAAVHHNEWMTVRVYHESMRDGGAPILILLCARLTGQHDEQGDNRAGAGHRQFRGQLLGGDGDDPQELHRQPRAGLGPAAAGLQGVRVAPRPEPAPSRGPHRTARRLREWVGGHPAVLLGAGTRTRAARRGCTPATTRLP